MIFYADPFATTHPAPAEGVGLDPLLRFPTMMIHPPMLYSGYTIAMIPLAFAMGALITRRLDAEWVRTIRRFAFAGWLFLGCGILLGAGWSYSELGWGGYWGWDAVENASLMPWLTATAFLHSLMLQEKRGMLKVWNVSLVLATGRADGDGHLPRAQRRAQLDPRLRRRDARCPVRLAGGDPDHRLDLPRRHAPGRAALAAPARFAVLARVDIPGQQPRSRRARVRDLLGHLLPTDLRAVTGQEASVGPPWFDRYTVPLALILVLLSGIGPVIAWRRSSLADVAAQPRGPRRGLRRGVRAGRTLVGIGATIAWRDADVLLPALRARPRRAGVRPRRRRARGRSRASRFRRALVPLVRRNRRRYGGYIVHVGIVALFVGVAASSSFQHADESSSAPGPERTRSGPTGSATCARPLRSRPRTTAPTRAQRSTSAPTGRHQEAAATSRRSARRVGFYASGEPAQGSVGSLIGGQPVSHVGIDRRVTRDVWTAIAPNIETPQLKRIVKLGNATLSSNEAIVALIYLARTYLRNPPPAQFHFLVSPLVIWIWIGGLIAASARLSRSGRRRRRCAGPSRSRARGRGLGAARA